jgi:hypothetical protein
MGGLLCSCTLIYLLCTRNNLPAAELIIVQSIIIEVIIIDCEHVLFYIHANVNIYFGIFKFLSFFFSCYQYYYRTDIIF